jgi:hypothetical protein
MKKSELKKLIKEVICEAGFIDTLMSIMSPTGKAKQLTGKAVKSKEFQSALTKYLNNVMNIIIKSSSGKSSQLIKNKILSSVYGVAHESLKKQGIHSESQFITRFNALYPKDYTLSLPDDTDINKLKSDIDVLEQLIQSDPSSPFLSIRKNILNNKKNELKIKEENFESVKSVIKSHTEIIKQDLMRFLKTAK